MVRKLILCKKLCADVGSGPPSSRMHPSLLANRSRRFIDLVQRIDVPVGASDVDGAVGDSRRGKNGADRHHFLDAGDHVIVEKIEEGGFILIESRII